MTPLATIADAVAMARTATDPDERQRWLDAAHSVIDRMMNGETEPSRPSDPRRTAVERLFAAGGKQ